MSAGAWPAGDLAEDLVYCPGCNGSGEGSHEGAGCSMCGGEGEIPDPALAGDDGLWVDPDDTFYMVDAQARDATRLPGWFWPAAAAVVAVVSAVSYWMPAPAGMVVVQ